MKSSGKNKSATKSSATIGDFFPLKKSTTKNKRNKDEQERSGKKLKKNEENIFSNKLKFLLKKIPIAESNL